MNLALAESVPASGAYSLSTFKPGQAVNAHDIPARFTGQGYPLAPQGETELSHWLLPLANAVGYFDSEGRGPGNAASGAWESRKLAEGECALLVTDRALRLTAVNADSEALGRFVGGRRLSSNNRSIPQSLIRIFACTWFYEDIWALDTPPSAGKAKELDVIGVHGLGLAIAAANRAKQGFYVKGLGLTNQVHDLAEAVTAAVVQHALRSGDHDRIRLATNVQAGQRHHDAQGERVARFRE